jgi:hypothetical protein
MKRPETERELIDLIVNTVKNSEEHYILGSWESFLKKRKQKRKFIVWLSITGFAASLIIGWLGFRFFVSDSSGFNTDSVLKQQITGIQETEVQKDTSMNQYLHGRDTLHLSVNNIAKHEGSAIPGQDYHDPKFKSLANTDSLKSDSLLKARVSHESRPDAGIQLSERKLADLLSDSVKTELSSQAGVTKPAKYVAANQKTDSSVINFLPGYPVAELNPEILNAAPVDEITKKLRFGVSFSPGVTSTNTVSSFNYSGGISADMDLSRRFRFSTGLQLEHQNVINEATDSPAWVPAGQTEASLVSLDLPLNLTWKVLVRKSVCYYLSGGISSIAYLSEKYITTSYSQKMVSVVSMQEGEQTVDYKLENIENTEIKTGEPLNTIDFAGRVNIILGFEKHLPSGIYLHIEPYLKIPVSQLATRDLKFTTSGITCKISF